MQHISWQHLFGYDHNHGQITPKYQETMPRNFPSRIVTINLEVPTMNEGKKKEYCQQ